MGSTGIAGGVKRPVPNSHGKPSSCAPHHLEIGRDISDTFAAPRPAFVPA
jgi:hypothetical protein